MLHDISIYRQRNKYMFAFFFILGIPYNLQNSQSIRTNETPSYTHLHILHMISHYGASIRVVVAKKASSGMLVHNGVRWPLVVPGRHMGIIVAVLPVVIRRRRSVGIRMDGIIGYMTLTRMVVMVVVLSIVTVVFDIVGVRPQHGRPPRLPHHLENLLLVHPTCHCHLLPHHVYVNIIHTWICRVECVRYYI